MSHDLDPVNRQIIHILQKDGRTPNVEIARRTGISEATVRKRLDRLVATGTIKITAIPDPAKIGLSTTTFLSFDVALGQLDQIADQLARLPEVRAIYYTTGESNLIVEAWFSCSEELLRFLTQQVASISGIKKTATSHVLRTIKDGSNWVLPPTAPPCVLVVDDDPDFVEIIRLTLSGEGYTVASASNGEEALALMRVTRPDLVILDIMMRGVLDGVRTGQEMRVEGDLRTVPILMVSSITESAFAGLLPREEHLPIDNFLVKPIEACQLLAEVRRLTRVR